ncbi:hypothetical protein F4781DRAFT_138288 [Annulohypoxylon bovei var. microspora]|nr:hypothetical protein F4781DRAFT_138288 [Annulohypoxylon bovei var. microspora]
MNCGVFGGVAKRVFRGAGGVIIERFGLQSSSVTIVCPEDVRAWGLVHFSSMRLAPYVTDKGYHKPISVEAIQSCVRGADGEGSTRYLCKNLTVSGNIYCTPNYDWLGGGSAFGSWHLLNTGHEDREAVNDEDT